MKRRFALVLCFLLLALSGAAQTPYFNRRYSTELGLRLNYIKSISVTPTGYMTFGDFYNTSFGADIALILQKLDIQGNVQSVQHYGINQRSFYSTFVGNGAYLRHPAGGFVMTGSTILPNAIYPKQPMLWRFDGNGLAMWTEIYPQPGPCVTKVGCVTADSGCALVGTLLQTTLLIRTDSLGQLLWQRQYGTGRYYCVPYHIAPTRDGGFLISGNMGPYLRRNEPCVLKVDAAGTLQWQRTFGTVTGTFRHNDGPGVAIPAADGGYWVAATLDRGPVPGSSPPTLNDSLFSTYYRYQRVIYRLDSAGNTLWQRLVGRARVEAVFYVLHELPDGAVVAAGWQCDDDPAGTSLPAGRGWPEGFAVKLCPDGDSVWWRTYKQLSGGSSHNYLNDFQPTPDGGFVGAGYVIPYPPDTGRVDAWVFRTDSAGNLLANGPPPAAGCSPLGLATIPAVPAIAVYPNPSPDGWFTLEAEEFERPGTWAVLDALGRTVAAGRLTDKQTRLDLRAHPPGLYLLRLTGGDGRTVTRKLVR